MKRKAAARGRRRPDQRARTPKPASEAGPGPPFDAHFFLSQLGGFVRDRCPPPEAGLPNVELHLVDGEVFDLCHVIGVAPGWVALAINEPVGPTLPPRMRTELVPYVSILRVTVRTTPSSTAHIGFDSRHAPYVLDLERQPPMTPEGALRAARIGGSPKPARSPRLVS